MTCAIRNGYAPALPPFCILQNAEQMSIYTNLFFPNNTSFPEVQLLERGYYFLSLTTELG